VWKKTREGTVIRQFVPQHYTWAEPTYDLVHTSIVDCQRDLLGHLKGETTAETNGDDNLKTVKLFSTRDTRTGVFNFRSRIPS
jgi:D-apiose dehydrogenase